MEPSRIGEDRLNQHTPGGHPPNAAFSELLSEVKIEVQEIGRRHQVTFVHHVLVDTIPTPNVKDRLSQPVAVLDGYCRAICTVVE